MKRLGSTVPSILLLLLMVSSASFARAQGEAGKQIFEKKVCGGCHLIVGPSKVSSIAERQAQRGPDLWFAGSKYNQSWLEAWLQNPAPIRGTRWGTLEIGSTTHVALAPGEAKAVALFLGTLVDSYSPTGIFKPGKKMSKSKRLKAKKLFEKAQTCYACHKTPVKRGKKVVRVVGGFTGPTFVDAGKRLRADWVYGFLKEPQSFEPFGRMPVYGDKIFTKFSDRDLKLLAEYVASF